MSCSIFVNLATRMDDTATPCSLFSDYYDHISTNQLVFTKAIHATHPNSLCWYSHLVLRPPCNNC